MIAVWMLYCLAIGVAFSVVGYALERALHYAGRPMRWAWMIAMVGSYLIPVAAWLRPEAFATFAVPIPGVVESGPSFATSTISTKVDQYPSPIVSLTDLDFPLRWGWVVASLVLIGFVGRGARRLAVLQRRWRQENVEGRRILISPAFGPAVVGLWSPRVVLPEWTLEVSKHERAMILRHEEQHIRVGDPALNALGLLLIVMAPWNLSLWWQWRRLRLAVEVDCDARVLTGGCSAMAYAELLLRVGHQRRGQLIGAPAFGEPVSFLESRIRRMLATAPRWRWMGAAAAALVAIAAIVVACETPRPLNPPDRAAEPLAVLPVHGIADGVFTESAVDERPEYLSGPMLVYPELLRRAGVEGQVLLQAIIDTTGRAESSSIKVISSPNPGLDEAAKRWFLGAHFRAARVHGRVVRVLMTIPCDFTINVRSTASNPERITRELQSARIDDNHRRAEQKA